jgi:hypothetical protein
MFAIFYRTPQHFGAVSLEVRMPAHRGQSGRCTVCVHPEKARIEFLIAGSGASHRAVGRKYSISHYSIGRHWKNCVSDERKAGLLFGPVEREALASLVAEESSSVLDWT